jgi:predicted O-methyltransferase YrrM
MSFRRFAALALQRPLQAALRVASTEYRAYGDLFDPIYMDRVDWQSGFGEGLATLYGLARSLRPAVVVETGSARGKSTCALALACKLNRRGTVYAIDPHSTNDWSEIGTDGNNLAFLQERLRRYRLNPWCRILRTTSTEAIKGWTEKIDLFLIDGDHSYEGVKADFELFRPFLRPTSLVVFHDTMWEYLRENEHYRTSMGVPRYLADLKDQGFHTVTLPCVPGVTLLQPRPGGFDFLPNGPTLEPAFVS